MSLLLSRSGLHRARIYDGDLETIPRTRTMTRSRKTLGMLVGEMAVDLAATCTPALAAMDNPLWTPLARQPDRGIYLPDGRLLSPQEAAAESLADELGFGGGAGGGKTDLVIGLAVTRHQNSVIFRKEFTQFQGADGLIARSKQIIGLRGEFNENKHLWHDLPGGRSLEFGAVAHEKRRSKWQGRPHDLKGFDEVTQISEMLYRFLIGWLRTTTSGQRCRVVSTFNPPSTEEERWVLRYWAPWLDPHHPHPASSGELRWYVVVDDKDIEVDDGTPLVRGGKPGCPHLILPEHLQCPDCHGAILRPRSRTFIPSSVEDNPYYLRTGYADTLNAMPEPYRSQLRHGNFLAGVKDDEWQVMPTAWVIAAQQRWTSTGGVDADGTPVPLTQVGVDPSRGGTAEFVIAKSHRGWIAPLVIHPATAAPTGQAGAALVFKAVLSKTVPIQIDIGGSAGSSVYDQCRDLGLQAIDLDGSRASKATDKSKKLHFVNKRAAWHWRMRELLDPDNPDRVALPPDPQLRADLCAARWHPTPRGIRIEEKDEIMKRLGRSPDRGEGVIYACVQDRVVSLYATPTAVGEGPSYWSGPS